MTDQPKKDQPEDSRTWSETFSSAAKSTGLFTAKTAVLAGAFFTGAGLAFTLTNMNNNNEKRIIDSATSSTPQMPIKISDDIQIVLSDTSLVVLSHGIPCSIPLDDPSIADITLGNTGEATVNEITSILETLGITAESHVIKQPSDNAEAILKLRYAAAAQCRADILKAKAIAPSMHYEIKPALAPTIPQDPPAPYFDIN